MFRLLLLVALSLPLAAAAQTYPSKPIRWILGYPPGGGTEFIARNVANTLQAQLGQPIVIENRPGAAAILGAEAAARSAPDGYTLFMADNGTFVFHTGIYKKLPYDPVKDFAPVGMIVKGYMILLSSQFATLKELVEAGMEVSPATPDEMAKTIRQDQAFWVPIIRKLGITVD